MSEDKGHVDGQTIVNTMNITTIVKSIEKLEKDNSSLLAEVLKNKNHLIELDQRLREYDKLLIQFKVRLLGTGPTS